MKSILKGGSKVSTIRMLAQRQAIISQSTMLHNNTLRQFSMPRYHFDDKDYEPTVTQVSLLMRLHLIYF